MKGVILLGGGLDSISLLVLMQSVPVKKRKFRLHALFIDYGQKAVKGELSSCRYFCKKYGVPLKVIKCEISKIAKASILKGQGKNYWKKGMTFAMISKDNCLEARNLIFFSLATTYAATIKANHIFVGYHREPAYAPFPDATVEAVEAFNNMVKCFLRPSKQNIHIVTPVSNMDRADLLKIGMSFDPEITSKAFTCYESKTLKECSKCAHCRIKSQMINAGSGKNHKVKV